MQPIIGLYAFTHKLLKWSWILKTQITKSPCWQIKSSSNAKIYTPPGSTWTTAPYTTRYTINIFSQMWEKGIAGYLGISMHGPLLPTRRYVLVPLSVRSTRKILIKSSAPQNLKKWGSASPTTARTDTILSKLSTGRSNSIRMKRVYHTLTPKTPGCGLRKNRPGEFWRVYQEINCHRQTC